MTTNLIQELLRQTPPSPGVYIMRDARGNVLYVGKAVNLHNRVRSYFTSPAKLTPKTQLLVEHINDFEYFVVSSEQEALILELNLIKRYWPPYNVLLKDDKTFPYLKIKFTEEWPRLHITRRVENDGSHYFGPFANIHSLRRTLNVLKRIFPLRSCTKPLVINKNVRPCLQYHMGYCLGPCSDKVDRGEYDRVLAQLILFLEGKHENVTRSLRKKMEEASESLDFERAARFRDQLQAVSDVVEGQNIAMKVRGEQDAIAFASDKDQACVQVFMIRHGKLIGRESFTLKGTQNESPEQILNSFVKQFYNASTYIPKLLLLQYTIEDTNIIEDWLSKKKQARVRIEVPRRGKKAQLINIVAENARQGLEQLKIKQMAVPAAVSEALAEIQRELHLGQPPSRIEGYDISNIQGQDAVGSMVVFEEGRPKTSHYRRFKIKTVEGANDYAMLQEMLRRRFKRANGKNNNGSAWAIMPDLVLIDGGKGQLNAAREVLNEIGVNTVALASLAKENEELFIPGQSHPVVLPESSAGLKLLQRLRDEAHRFAITYFQKVHKKRTFTSALDEVDGIGPKKKKNLIKQFGTVSGIRQASIEELMAVEGINRSLAQKIKETL
ncbi:MAG: excinuclease ABC subunit UvrC [Dehalococcoidales bacterium]|nr:excinuclease ABC subunit UvrC [Dehalococcoidales bacterium]